MNENQVMKEKNSYQETQHLKNLEKYIKVKSAIFDSEAVGLDPSTQKMVDFQHTMKRRRKHNIEHHAGNIPLRFQIFDVMFINNKNVMGKDYLKRREVLNKIITNNHLSLAYKRENCIGKRVIM